jgi:hypothetical protein
MNDALREGLEAWEREAAAYWDHVTRSPDFLRRVGEQISQSFQSQQRITTALQTAMFQAATFSQTGARELYLLQRLEKQITVLAARIEQLERTLGDD